MAAITGRFNFHTPAILLKNPRRALGQYPGRITTSHGIIYQQGMMHRKKKFDSVYNLIWQLSKCYHIDFFSSESSRSRRTDFTRI
jgi:hypothetical protein